MREKGVEDISEDIRAENFPNLRKETDIQVQDLHNSKQDEPNEVSPRHIVIKIAKIKDKARIFKSSKGKAAS